MLWSQITRGRVDFNGDPAVKSHCWKRVLNLQPLDPDLLCFAAVPSLQVVAIIMGEFVFRFDLFFHPGILFFCLFLPWHLVVCRGLALRLKQSRQFKSKRLPIRNPNLKIENVGPTCLEVTSLK